MNLARSAPNKRLELIPYTLLPSVDLASEFGPKQWLSLEACALGGRFTISRNEADAPTTEMCAAATMGLGGKRAFLPTAVDGKGNWLHVQLIYFGRPWRVGAARLLATARAQCSKS